VSEYFLDHLLGLTEKICRFFGTQENPGPAAIYNDRALVVYKPTATFTFGSTADYNAAKSAQAQASISGGLWGAKASAEGSQSGAT
jgi:hypothetical protein